MLNEALFALELGLVDGWNAAVCWETVVAVFGAAAFGAVWLGGGAGDAPTDDEIEAKERTASAFRVFSEIVSAIIAARDAQKERENGAERDGENSGDGSDSAVSNDFNAELGAETADFPSANGKAASTPSELGALNAVDFWREDYWNYDFGLEREKFGSEEDDSADDFEKKIQEINEKSNAATQNGADSRPVRNDRDPREGLDPSPEETESRRRSGNYFGAFFQKRNRANSEKDGANDGNDADSSTNADGADLPRWKRPKSDAPKTNDSRRRFNFNGKNENSGDDSNAEKNDDVPPPFVDDSALSSGGGAAGSIPFASSEPVDAKDDETLFENGDEDEKSDKSVKNDADSDDSDDDSSELEFDYWDDGAVWDDGPNEKFLDDDSISDDEKIAYLRDRIEAGDDASRDELARLLVQVAADAGADAREKALAALDEAETIATESADASNGDEERAEFLGQVLLQRPLFYLRNGLEPPMQAANDALARIRDWAENSANPDARRLLATAWQTQGNCLAAIGCEAAAVASQQKAVELFDEIVGEGATDAEPSLGYASAALGETYLRVGDAPRSIAAFRRAVETFDKFASQEPFLAEKVNVLFRLSVALRENGDDAGAEAVLHDAVDAEERLLSFDEEDYIAPLAQLLNVQADFYVRRGAFEDAFVALDGAISALKRFLACDVALSSRVRAYLLLETTFRKRATVCLWTERYSAAIRDVEEGLEYLALATKKEENLQPFSQLVSFSGLMYDCGAARDDWTFVPEAQELIEELVARLTTDELKTVAPLYGQLLLQRHVALAKEGRIDDALAATNRAIAALETGLVDDGELEYRVLLAKALFQRGVFEFEIQENLENSLADLTRAQKLYEEARLDGELDESSAAIYFEALSRKSFIEIKIDDFDAARADLRLGIAETTKLLRKKRWNRLDELENLSRTSVLWAQIARDDEFALRVVRLWTRYWRRFRRFFVESSWNVEQKPSGAFDERAPEETDEIQKTLMKIEGAIADLRRIRAEILEPLDWKDEFARYFDRSDFENSSVGVSSDEDAVSPFDSLKNFDLDAERGRFEAEFLANAPKNRALFNDRLFCFRVVKRRVERGNLSLTRILYRLLDKLTDVYLADDALLLSAAETLATTRLLETAEPWRRAKTDKNASKNKKLANKSNADSPQTAKSRQNASEIETSASKNADSPIFAGPFVADDAPFFAEIFPFWEMQTAFLARLTTAKTLDDAPRGFDVDLADATFRTTLEIARRSGGFDGLGAEFSDVSADENAPDAPEIADKSVSNDVENAFQNGSNDCENVDKKATDEPKIDDENASEPDPIALEIPTPAILQAATAKFRVVGTVSAYFSWLLKTGRVDAAIALVRREERRLQATFGREDAPSFERSAATAFYLGVGGAALENGLFDEARRAFSAAESLLKDEEKSGGDLSVWERQGDAQVRLARLAAFQDDFAEMKARFRGALDYYWRYLQDGSFDEDVFRSFVKISLFFLEENVAFEDGETALSRTLALAKTATQNWSDEAKSATIGAFWRLKTAAAEYCSKSKRNADCAKTKKKRSFHFLRQLYREANELLTADVLVDLPARLVGNAKFEEGQFWANSGFLTRGRRAFQEAIEHWNRALSEFKIDAEDDTPLAKTQIKTRVRNTIAFWRRNRRDATEKTQNAIASERSTSATTRAEIENLRWNVLAARFYVATTFSQEGEIEKARPIFEAVLAETGPLAECAAREVAAAGRSSKRRARPDVATAVEFLKFALAVERGAAEFETDADESDAARARCRRATRTAREFFGKNSDVARPIALYWADAALKGRRFRLALRLAKRYLNTTCKKPLDGADSTLALFRSAALKVRAVALLERGRRADFARADRAISQALELLRDEFRRGAFELRGFFAETLFVRARIKARQQNFDAARTDALRTRRIVETLIRRGQRYRERFLRDEIEPFLMSPELQTPKNDAERARSTPPDAPLVPERVQSKPKNVENVVDVDSPTFRNCNDVKFSADFLKNDKEKGSR